MPPWFGATFQPTLITSNFQWGHKLLPSDEEVRDFWNINLAELKQLTKMSHLRSFHQFIHDDVAILAESVILARAIGNVADKLVSQTEKVDSEIDDEKATVDPHSVWRVSHTHTYMSKF